MALSQRLQVRQAQSLTMTPQLQQAIKLLQMPNLELSAYLEEQLAENPLLEVRDPEGGDADAATPEPAVRERDSADVVGGDEGFGRQLEASDTDYANVWDGGGSADGAPAGDGGGLLWDSRGGSAGAAGGAWEDGGGWEAFAVSPVSLREHLAAQIGEEFADPIDRRAALMIADNLDEAGYFAGDEAEMAQAG